MKKIIFTLFAISISSLANTTEYIGKGEYIPETIMANKTNEIPNWGLGFFGGVEVDSNYDWEFDNHSNNSSITESFDGSEKIGWETGVELQRNINEFFSTGIGASYQDHSKGHNYSYDFSGTASRPSVHYDETAGSFDSAPVYLFGKYAFGNLGKLRPYIKGDVGYSFNFGEGDFEARGSNGDFFHPKLKVDNGIYYGAGMGLEYKNLFGEVMYKMQEAKFETDNFNGTEKYRGEVDYSRIITNLGYRFNF